MDANDTLFAEYNAAGDSPLPGNGTYTFTGDVTVPTVSPRDAFLLVVTDAGGSQPETDESNVFPVAVRLEAPDDLVVSAATAPASASWGEKIQLGWTTANQGIAPAFGTWADAVYLSADQSLDAADKLLTEYDASSHRPLANGGR